MTHTHFTACSVLGSGWVIKGGTLALFLEVKFAPCFLSLIWLVMDTAEGLGRGLANIRWAQYEGPTGLMSCLCSHHYSVVIKTPSPASVPALPGPPRAFVSLSKALTGSGGWGPQEEKGAASIQSPRPLALAPCLPKCQL